MATETPHDKETGVTEHPEQKPTVKKPLRPITQLLISIAIIAVVVMATIFLFKYPQKLGPIFITALVVTLASFLLLLILRHFILIWFSYLHQRELSQESRSEEHTSELQSHSHL